MLKLKAYSIKLNRIDKSDNPFSKDMFGLIVPPESEPPTRRSHKKSSPAFDSAKSYFEVPSSRLAHVVGRSDVFCQIQRYQFEFSPPTGHRLLG